MKKSRKEGAEEKKTLTDEGEAPRVLDEGASDGGAQNVADVGVRVPDAEDGGALGASRKPVADGGHHRRPTGGRHGAGEDLHEHVVVVGVNVEIEAEAEEHRPDSRQHHPDRQEVANVASLSNVAVDVHEDGVGDQKGGVEAAQLGIGVLVVERRPVAPVLGVVDAGRRRQERAVLVQRRLRHAQRPPNDVVHDVADEGGDEDGDLVELRLGERGPLVKRLQDEHGNRSGHICRQD